MRRLLHVVRLALVVAWSGSLAPAQDAPKRAASAIVAEYDGVQYPSMSEGSDPESLARFSKAIEDAAHRQEACALELLQQHPGHARVPELLKMRWQLLVNVDHDCASVRRETEHVTEERLVPVALVARAWACTNDDSLPAATRVADLEHAVKVVPDDFLARVALLEYAERKSGDPEFQRDVAQRVAALDASSGAEGDDARKFLKLLAWIGKPWPSTPAPNSTDAAEPPLALGALKGRPVVVSFFPTPYMSSEAIEATALAALAKEFEGDGLEVVVVHPTYSSDDLDDRKKHVASLGLPGRSCYERKGEGPSLLERALGADVPVLACLIDRDGKLAALSVEAKSLRPALVKLGGSKAKRRPI